jgi:hypothetical protein
MVHFSSDTVGLGELLAKLLPVVKAYARAQIRKPVDVSPRLNAEGYMTAEGVPWTPRLVHFLLALMFNDPKADEKPENRSARPGRLATASSASPGAPKVSMDDRDALANVHALTAADKPKPHRGNVELCAMHVGSH